jgi:hypothetical protein
MADWHDNLVNDEQGVLRILRDARRIAVLGIKTEEQGGPRITSPNICSGSATR